MTKERPSPTLEYEEALWKQGFFAVAGIDEAGRGCWAGPVMAGAVILPAESRIAERLQGVRDSKLMTAAERDEMYEAVTRESAAWAVGKADNMEIDRIGILNATKNAMKRAIAGLEMKPDHLLIDFVRLHDVTTPQIGLKHGDMLCLSIACASIIAKVTRDRWMQAEASALYPQYSFEKHKGYGTAQHMEALRRYGPCPIHRMSFRPLSEDAKLF